MHPILADRQRLSLHLVASVLIGAMLSLLVRALLGVAWPAAFAFGLPMGLVAAPVSLSAWYLCRAMPLGRTNTMRVAVTALVAAFVTSAMWAAIGHAWWQALRRLDLSLAESPAGLAALLAGLGALAYLLALTVQYMLQAFEESAAAARRALESQIAQRDAELRALRAQVDPHFLFNSLNAIAGLVGAHPDRARRMCQLLGDFLRDSLTLGAAARIPLGREAALAEQYLAIEHVRFGARLVLRVTVGERAATVPVPPLILQPLVENAVRHGIATTLEGGLIEVSAERAGARAVVTVVNPRDPDGSRRGTGFGLEIVRRRLAASFGDRAALSTEARPDSYRVTVTVPIEETS
jgi:sensor histidine kinase YesM